MIGQCFSAVGCKFERVCKITLNRTYRTHFLFSFFYDALIPQRNNTLTSLSSPNQQHHSHTARIPTQYTTHTTPTTHPQPTTHHTNCKHLPHHTTHTTHATTTHHTTLQITHGTHSDRQHQIAGRESAHGSGRVKQKRRRCSSSSSSSRG